jgi:hypothetical protein
MSRNPIPDPPRPLLHSALFGLLLFSVILRAALTLNRELDMDEFQHLHTAWMVSRHYLIYRDFWEPHTPLLYYLLLPLFHFFREGPGLVIAARVVMSLTAFGILYMTYALSRLVNDRLTSLLAVLVLSYAFLFVQKSVEVRPDQPLVILWLASLWVSARALSGGRRPLWFFYAGLLLGVGFLFSPKALIPLGALGFTLTALLFLPNPRRSLLSFLKIQCAYVSGFLPPALACLAFFYHLGALREMFNYTLLENFTFPHTYHPTYLLYLRNICFFVLAFAGIAICVRNFQSYTRLERVCHLALLLPALFLLAVTLFLVAYPFPQITLLFLPLFAVYGAGAFRNSLDRVLTPRRTPDGAQSGRVMPSPKGALFFACTTAAALLIPCALLLLKERPFTKTNAGQFRTMEYVLSLTRPTDAVFDGEEAYVFRPQAYFYGSLVQGVVWRIQHGEVNDDIPRSLISTDCRVVIYDGRVATLPRPDQLFIESRYEPSPEPGVYLKRGYLPGH